MRKKKYDCCWFLALLLLLCGCSSKEVAAPGDAAAPSGSYTDSADLAETGTHWDNSIKISMPEAAGTECIGNSSIIIDISNGSDGYIMALYTGTADKIKFFITTPEQVKYTYDLQADGLYSTLPLTGGSGTYSIQVMEHVQDKLYSTLYTDTISTEINNEFSPFLYPNQYTWFTANSAAVQKAAELTAGAEDAIDALKQIYDYVTVNIRYDEAKAASVTASYLPDIDETLAGGTGICFDYAALMTAMLRSQGIPTKLEIGYSGDVYHAWISTYIEETGWVNNVVYFDGQTWSLMDPTLAAANGEQSVRQYIGDGSHYIVKYSR